MISFASRILKIYFRNKTAVFFSLFSSFIMIGLYILFLGETYSSNFKDISQIQQLMDQWIMAGTLVTTSVSTTIAAFSIMVDDVTKKFKKTFIALP